MQCAVLSFSLYKRGLYTGNDLKKTRFIRERKDRAMQLGIVGLPNVGKSTLFNSLTKAGAESANYPFCTIDPNVGVVPVPDERLRCPQARCNNSAKVVPAVIEFVDIAGLGKRSIQGRGTGQPVFMLTFVKWMPSFMWYAVLKIPTLFMWMAALIHCVILRPLTLS